VLQKVGVFNGGRVRMYHLPRKQVGSVENSMQVHKGHDYNIGSQSPCWLVSKQVGPHRYRRSEDAHAPELLRRSGYGNPLRYRTKILLIVIDDDNMQADNIWPHYFI